MSVDYVIIGQRIKSKRRSLAWTQDRLAEKLSVSVGYISQIERGVTKVSLDTLAEISHCLGCDIIEFLDGVSPAQSNYLNTELRDVYQTMTREQRSMLLDMANVIAKYGLNSFKEGP